MKKIALLTALIIGLPHLAAAADVTAPVKQIMDATAKNWSGADTDWIDIFDESKVGQIYSQDFEAKYKAAAENPAADEDGISPFDYDVIVNGEDACPLEDVQMAPQPTNGATTEVVVKFKAARCMDGTPEKDADTEVRFEMIDEAGKPVVDDIVTKGDDGQPSSLKQTMVQIAKGQ